MSHFSLTARTGLSSSKTCIGHVTTAKLLGVLATMLLALLLVTAAQAQDDDSDDDFVDPT